MINTAIYTGMRIDEIMGHGRTLTLSLKPSILQKAIPTLLKKLKSLKLRHL